MNNILEVISKQLKNQSYINKYQILFKYVYFQIESREIMKLEKMVYLPSLSIRTETNLLRYEICVVDTMIRIGII